MSEKDVNETLKTLNSRGKNMAFLTETLLELGFSACGVSLQTTLLNARCKF